MSNILIVRYLLAVGLQMISQMATGCAPRSMAGCVRSSSWTEVSFECENKCLLLPFSHCKRASFKSLHCGFESARPGVCKHWDIAFTSLLGVRLNLFCSCFFSARKGLKVIRLGFGGAFLKEPSHVVIVLEKVWCYWNAFKGISWTTSHNWVVISITIIEI